MAKAIKTKTHGIFKTVNIRVNVKKITLKIVITIYWRV